MSTVKRWSVVGRNDAYQHELMDVVKASHYDALDAEAARNYWALTGAVADLKEARDRIRELEGLLRESQERISKDWIARRDALIGIGASGQSTTPPVDGAL